ncbi:MAG: hypothetical protein KDK37_11300, partial [Leptospiraceae bacterium]|nr:hypothetical protein [Leptospiraceae bacterium]
MQDCEDIIVVGSGASGAAAALQCSGFRLKTLLVDVGISSEDSTNSSKHYYDRKKSENLEDLLLGRDLEGLEAALDGSELPFKLSMPLLKYITRREFDLPPRVSDAQLISTHAFGGLANGWSCGLYEYNERDLLGFPFAASDLAPYYSKLCREAGIVGRLDDLQPFFGNNISQDFSTISRKCGYLEEKYHARKEKLQENNGFYLGRARVALAGAKPGEQNGYELMANGEALYVPAQTVRRLLLRK